nr:hypothetical protein 13E11.240 [imported] - Neurospora crassa [Neurospora crassa]
MPFSEAKAEREDGPDLTGNSALRLVAESLRNPMNFNAQFQFNSFFQRNLPPDSSISEQWRKLPVSSKRSSAHTAGRPAEVWKVSSRAAVADWFPQPVGGWSHQSISSGTSHQNGSSALAPGFGIGWRLKGRYRGRALYEWRKSACSFTSSSGNTPSPTSSGGSITGHVGLPAGTRLRGFTNLPCFHVVRMIRVIVICVMSNKLQSLKGYLQRNAFHHDTIESSMALGDKRREGNVSLSLLRSLVRAQQQGDLTCALAGLIGIFLIGVSLVLDPWVSGME